MVCGGTVYRPCPRVEDTWVTASFTGPGECLRWPPTRELIQYYIPVCFSKVHTHTGTPACFADLMRFISTMCALFALIPEAVNCLILCGLACCGLFTLSFLAQAGKTANSIYPWLHIISLVSVQAFFTEDGLFSEVRCTFLSSLPCPVSSSLHPEEMMVVSEATTMKVLRHGGRQNQAATKLKMI